MEVSVRSDNVGSFDLKGIWNYRELLYFLALRDIKVRYTQTILGIAWVILQPVIITVIFTAVFQNLGIVHELGVPYPLFAFSGFVIWSFINSAVLNGSNSLISHSNLITKVYFPRLVIPLSAVAATLVDLLVGVAAIFGAMLIYEILPSWRSFLIVVPMVPAMLLTLGTVIFCSALNVRYRDVKHILPLVLQILFFTSPIFYSMSMVDPAKAWLWKFNPLTGILENFRAALFGLPFDWTGLAIASAISMVVFVISVVVFQRAVDEFADVI